MATDRVDRYLVLVEKLERLEDETKLLQHEIQTVMEAMTEAEERQAAEKLRQGHEAKVYALELHMEQWRSPPVE
ncbi:hypothetical protein SAMN05444161_9077 [Rhizobiales bacterium GAS191]|nr:hypothetical protein SAMN05519104_7661 [Rhizobiales bacterium GAS188]SEF14839.1 hypothetical protein SAMN05444161_9077 [Rhizobiales bacterium GAS191]